MNDSTFMNKLRSFLGISREPPRNDFRNPIWGSDDEDDGDELYSRQQMDVFTETLDLHQEFSRQMQEMFRSFGNMFGDMKSLFQDDQFNNLPAFTQTEPSLDGDTYNSKSLRDYYLKPGYHNRKQEPKEDIDLDGKISSNEISGLLKQKEDSHSSGQIVPFNGNMVPGRSFCQTIITTSVTKPDGTVETRRIVKNGNEVIEETTITSPDSSGPMIPEKVK
ncbi:hypothetical protein K1T71_006821 [Dendrolimus kikuchii]|uniref:Uncharacterized protein n=1 Tax=Dendrolimus kikuchii TaxID=765133 RepID=A0ACC1D236_9NEOP|nr:hypothetical protein K1T71_006821 [Dendrolimus kikuchii]